MTRTFTAALFQVAIDKGYMKCACGKKLDLSDAEDINEGRKIWNKHAEDCSGEEE